MRNCKKILTWYVVFLVLSFCILSAKWFHLTAQSVAAEADVDTPEPNAPVEAVSEPNKIEIAVTVNDINITETQIEDRIKPQLDKIPEQMPPHVVEQQKERLRQQALEGMIAERLLEEKIKEHKITITDQQMDEHIEQMLSQQDPPLSQEDLKALIEAMGQNFDQWKQQFQKRMSYEKLIEIQYPDKVNITEDDAKKYYSENKRRFERPEQVKASHILITIDATAADSNQAKTDAKAKAEKLLKQIKDGTDFAALAKENSGCPSAAKGGDLGFFGRDRMVPPFERAAFELEVGQVSDIVETRFGYHIIKLTDRKEAQKDTFEQVKDNILNMLKRRKLTELSKEYVESLKAKAKIVYPQGKEPKTHKPAADLSKLSKQAPTDSNTAPKSRNQAKDK